MGRVLTEGFEHRLTGLTGANQQDPPPAPDAYDGIALEAGRPVFFRGRGTGFSYRVPVDPTGGGDFLVGDVLQLGAEVPGLDPSLDGRMAIYFQPRTVFAEADRGQDVNLDGDTEDEFDVGQLRQVVWDVTTPDSPARHVGIGPANVLQERCNHGSDLTGDGFEDPIFLWDALTSELHVRLVLIDAKPAQVAATRAEGRAPAHGTLIRRIGVAKSVSATEGASINHSRGPGRPRSGRPP